MEEEIMEHIKNLKEQGINVRFHEDQINDLVNKIFDKKDKEDKEDNIYISKYIADLFNPQVGSGTSKKGKGLKILTNQQMLNRLPIFRAQIQAGNNSIKLKN